MRIRSRPCCVVLVVASLAAVLVSAGSASAATRPHPNTVCCGGGGSYTNYSAVVNYALNYAGSYLGTDSFIGWNPEYINEGNDCTNFVSQALHAGGWTNSSAYNQWWYFDDDPGHEDYPLDQFSTSWINVQAFVTFAYDSGRGIFINSGAKAANANWAQVVPGDILMVDWTGDGSLDHMMIVTSTSGKAWGQVKLSDIKITQHTTNRKNYALTNDTSAYPNSKWWIMEPY